MKSFDELYAVAEGNFGLVTYAEARECGIGIRELDRWVKAGRLEKPARGIYRVSRFPASEQDDFAVAVESVGSEAYLYGESVLALLKLCPTNPTWIYVASPKRVRRKLGERIKLIGGVDGYVYTNYDGVRSQKLRDAIVACRGYVRPDRRIVAVREGERQGYLSRAEAGRLMKEISDGAAS